ncbi:MAG: hypothetical protein WAX69_18280 [Victivallales bacterium]
MNCLLDTHTLLWSALDTGKLSVAAKSAILDTGVVSIFNSKN